MPTTYQTLSPEQAEHFVEYGYVTVKGCLPREVAERWTSHAFERLGYDPNNSATWERELVHMDHETCVPVSELSPKGWGAICDVLGGEERIEPEVLEIESRHFTTINSFEWSDSFIVNFNRGANEPWQPPSPEVKGWHKDGSYFRHFLNSPEQALLNAVYWTDVEHQGGGTFIAPDSIPIIARVLAEHPEGLKRYPFGELINQCKEFIEVTAEVGDLVIMHPYMLHASSQNHSGKARFMTNPPVMLREPMELNRDNPDDFSLLERATLHALGVDRYDFQPTGEREKVGMA